MTEAKGVEPLCANGDAIRDRVTAQLARYQQRPNAGLAWLQLPLEIGKWGGYSAYTRWNKGTGADHD